MFSDDYSVSIIQICNDRGGAKGQTVDPMNPRDNVPIIAADLHSYELGKSKLSQFYTRYTVMHRGDNRSKLSQ
jgi:hypothetical protein